MRNKVTKMLRGSTAVQAAIVLLVCLLGTPAWGQWDDPEPTLGPLTDGGTLRARVGSGVLLTLRGDVERVALADEQIARPQVISTREVLLTGLVPGRTTVFVWLVDGGRLRYYLHVVRDLGLVVRALQDLDPDIVVEVSDDGASAVVRGEVENRRVAREAGARAKSLLEPLKIRVVDLLTYPGAAITVEEQLESALHSIDRRIRVQRIQVGPDPDPAQDSYLLEGWVENLQSLVRAITVSERQLGGSGTEVRAANNQQLSHQRQRGFFGNGAGGSGGGAGNLQGSNPPEGGLTNQLARGLVLTSESGRVISMIEVDELPQVLVSIRVVEVNRTKAKKVGINWRFDNDHVSVGNVLSPSVAGLPAAASDLVAGTGPSIGGIGGTNLVGAFVDQMSAVVAAVDLLEDKALARSVAEPNVLTLSGEAATVIVGGEVPIPSTSINQVASTQGFFFQDFGVRLDIRPTVVNGDMIALEVQPSITRRSIALGVGDVPGFQVQSVQTTARVQAGQSLVLGGLLSFEEGLEERKLPGLGWLPGVGRWRRKSRDEMELLFIISPQLVETPTVDEPAPVVKMPDLDEVELPELDWPEDRQRWRDEFEPQDARPDGVPPAFLPHEDADGGLYGYSPPADDQDAVDGFVDDDGSVRNLGDTHTTDTDDGIDAWTEDFEESSVAVETETWTEAAPGAMADGVEVRVVDAEPCLNLRFEPGTWDEPLDCLPTGTLVAIIEERDGGWARVALADGFEGWMAERFLAQTSAGGRLFAAERLTHLNSERNSLASQMDAVEAADQELEERLRAVQSEIQRLQPEPPPID